MAAEGYVFPKIPIFLRLLSDVARLHTWPSWALNDQSTLMRSVPSL